MTRPFLRESCAVVLLAAPLVADAADCGGALGFATDNVYRGVSLSGERPAWLLDGHCAFASGWVAGVAANRVHLVGRSANAQVSVYLDRRWQFADGWSAKVGAVHYDAASRAGQDGLRYDELNAAIGYRGRWTASIGVSPNATDLYFRGAMPPIAGIEQRTYRNVWVEGTVHQPLVGRLALDAGAGIAFPGGSGNSDYRYGSLGLVWGTGDVYVYATRLWTESIRWRFEYLGTPMEAALPQRNGWVASMVWAF